MQRNDNRTRFINFCCEMIEKYSSDVMEEIGEKSKENEITNDEIVGECE